MTDRDKLPAKTTTGNLVVQTEQSGSLVARGLEAIRDRQELKPCPLRFRLRLQENCRSVPVGTARSLVPGCTRP